MAIAEERHTMPAIQNPNLTPSNLGEQHIISQTSSSHPKEEQSPKNLKKLASPKDTMIAVASRVASQPLPCSDPDVWGVLTAISNNARKRTQGINILLTADTHTIGRLVEDVRFQIDNTAVSQRHCVISRKRVLKEDVESPSGFGKTTFLKDTSTNGTYLNWERLKRGSTKFEANIRHGDIISFAALPQHEQAYAFVYREVLSSDQSSDANVLKRKAEDFDLDNKRLKGIGIGAPDGPISLDDFRSLQRSNAELRKQLESQVLTIEELRNENRVAIEHHQNEIKELRDSVSRPYLDQLNVLNESLETTKKELTEVNKNSAEQKHSIEDLNVRLTAALQSCTEANEIIKSQKTSIAEHKTRLDEERDQRKEEREKAAADLKASIQRVQSEAQEELKRASDFAVKREREQQEVINKLQESERESSSLVESLRIKLEETRQKLVLCDNKIRQLEVQVSEEQQASVTKKFCKIVPRNFENQLRIPRHLVENFQGRLSGSVTLIGPSRNEWTVQLERREEDVWFSSGWEAFVIDHGIDLHDVLVFTYVDDTTFEVVVFSAMGCERESSHFTCVNSENALCRCTLHVEGNASPVMEDVGYDFELGETEVNFPQASAKESHKTKAEASHNNAVYKGKRKLVSLPSSYQFVESDNNFEDEDEEKEEEEEGAEGSFSCSRHPSTFGRKQTQKCHISRRRRVTEKEKQRACDLSEEEEGAEGSFSCSRHPSTFDRKQTQTCHISHRRMVTEKEKQSACDLSKKFIINRRKSSGNPMVGLIMLRTHVYRGLYLTIPKKWAVKNMSRKDHEVELRVKGTNDFWLVGCRWTRGAVQCQFRAKWAKFVLDNNLEEGDACVFEMIRKGNAQAKTRPVFLVQIFRVVQKLVPLTPKRMVI